MSVFRRQDCPAGTQFYTCASSGFRGCCAVDACDFDDGCPDAATTAKPSSTARTTAVTTTSQATTKTTGRESPTASTSTTSPTSSATRSTSSSTSRSTPSNTTTTSPSSSSSSSSTAPPITAGPGDNPSSPSHGLPNSAIGGIVAAGVVGLLLVAGLVLWRIHRRNQQLRQRSVQASATGGPPASPATGPPLRRSGLSPASPRGWPASDEKSGLLGIGHSSNNASANASASASASARTTPEMSNNPPTYMHALPASPTSPASTVMPLFAEADGGDVEAAIARWGLHGARLAAQRRSQQHGSLRSQTATADLGSSYLGPGSPTYAPVGIQAAPQTPAAPQIPHTPELDGCSMPAVAELATPDSPPPIRSNEYACAYSPSLSGGSPMGTRSLTASSWRVSSRTAGSGSEAAFAADPISFTPTPEAIHTPQMPGRAPGPQPSPTPPQSPSRQTSVTDVPRATLDISRGEQSRGIHVASWGSYQQ